MSTCISNTTYYDCLYFQINIRRRNASYRHIMAAAGQSNGHGNQTRTPQSIATAASIASRDAARSTFTLSRPTNKSAKR